MKDSKLSETAPSADETVHDTKTYTDRVRSSTDVSKVEGSSFSCLSMKSDNSRFQPPLFSSDHPDTDFEHPNESRYDFHWLEEVGQKSDHWFKESLLVEQSADGILQSYQRQLKSSLKQMYEPLEGTQNTRVCVREGLSAELHQMDPPFSMELSDLLSGSVRTLLTLGSAGVGKSVLVQRSIMDWCEDRALQHIQLLCPLPLSQLNLLQQQSWTLMELLQTFCPGLRESGITELTNYRVLFILDALDECRLKLDFSKHQHCEAEAAMSVDALLSNLMLGNLLPEAQLWIICRPGAARSIPPTLIHRVSEVMGFSEPQLLQNIQELQEKVSASSAALHSMCLLPLFCSITASVSHTHSTVTQLFLHFLSYHMKTMQQRYGLQRSRVSTVVQALSRLAHQQLQRGELLFSEDQLTDQGLEVTEALLYSGLCSQIFTEYGCGGHWTFSFVHLCLQEFLSALFIHISSCGDRETDLDGAVRDHPLVLHFLQELAEDSSVSLLMQENKQSGCSTETHTDCRRTSAQFGEADPPSEREQPTVSASDDPTGIIAWPQTHSRNPATKRTRASLCRSQARVNGEGHAKKN